MAAASLRSFVRSLFSLSTPVDRKTYLTTGLVLMAFKYAIDNAIVFAATGSFWSPLRYFSPIFTMREGSLQLAPSVNEWFTLAMVVWAVPFIWIGVTMSIRRARDAGMSPGLGLGFFVPFVNFILIALLSLLPTAAPREINEIQTSEAHRVRSALIGLGAGVGISVLMTVFATFVAGSYGGALFLGTPFIIGFFSAFYFNRPAPATLRATVAVMTLSLAAAGAALMLFALEGLFCLAMAFPIAWLLGLGGAVVGRAVALESRFGPGSSVILLLALPALLGFEVAGPGAREREVITSVEIDAPPQVVWDNVVGWTELPNDNLPWYFALGIAYPQRARLVGEGVGAVRYCEFSTGPFVEPITVWDEPHRLSFDVESQPPSMHEWSPWERVHAPHLDGYIVSHRGEFRLIELPGGRTRLEGSTWYHLSMWPQPYWTKLSDLLLHSIHRRVLEHVGNLAEAAHRAG